MSIAYDLVKTLKLSESTAEVEKKKTIPKFDSRLCNWLVRLLVLLPILTIFLLGHKQGSGKQNQTKWKCSDFSNSDSVELMTWLTTLIFNFYKVISSVMTTTTTTTPLLVNPNHKMTDEAQNH